MYRCARLGQIRVRCDLVAASRPGELKQRESWQKLTAVGDSRASAPKDDKREIGNSR